MAMAFSIVASALPIAMLYWPEALAFAPSAVAWSAVAFALLPSASASADVACAR